MGIKHLTFKENAFDWWKRGADKKVYFFGVFCQYSLLVL